MTETKSKSIEKVDKTEAVSARDVAGARQQLTAVPQVDGAFRIQRAAGNFAMQRMFRDGAAQVKPTTSCSQLYQLGDVYEPEADQVAGQVMRKRIDEPRADTGVGISGVPHVVQTVLKSGGWQPLDPATRAFMEPRFGHDFSRVRVHTDGRAAASARAVNSLAYTVGQDVVFDTGQYAPYSSTGQSLLAHELAHVIQQARGGASPSRFAANASNERAAIQAASMATLDGVAVVDGSSGVGIARAPRSLEVSLDPTTLSFTELEGEIQEIQRHLDANPFSNEENDQLMEVQSALRKQLAKRQKQEEGGGKRRPKDKISQVPRSLTESLRIDETLTDAELYSEIDAIHATLESGANKKDRATLKAALVALEAERQRREHARKIQRAFTPRVTSRDDEALIEVMGIVDSIRPSETASGLYTLVRDGELLVLTQEEYNKIRGAAQKTLLDRLGNVRQKADGAQYQYDEQRKINEDQYIVSGLVHFFGGIDDPGVDIARNVSIATVNANAAQVFIERGQLKRGAEFFTTSELFATIAKKTSQAYKDNLISTAGTTVTVLEITRDAAFATTLALGAAVAAPVVAAGAAGFGLSGASAAVVTAVGTGGVVGAEGAVLRGGSAAAGVAIAGGSMEEVLSAGKSEGRRGFIEGAATGVGGGLAHSAGVALKAGQSASKVVNIARGSLAQGLGNAAGSATSTGLEGGSATDVLKSAFTGGLVGTLTGPLSQGAGAIKNPVLGAVARTGVGAVVSGGQTYLETGDRDAAFRSAAIGGASSLALGPGKPGEGPTPAEKKAFEFGKEARSKVNSAARTVRNVTAATMLGLADAVPATRGTGAQVGDILGGPVPTIAAVETPPTVAAPKTSLEMPKPVEGQAAQSSRLAVDPEIEADVEHSFVESAESGPAASRRPQRPTVTGQAQAARARFNGLRDGYAQQLGVGQGGQVHHAIELQVLDRYPGVYTEAELNALTNMRGIPGEDVGRRQLHNSKIREIMDRHYSTLDDEIVRQGLNPGTQDYNNSVRRYLTDARNEIDYVLGQFFSEYRSGLPRSFQ